jgi:hypothetical protein
MVIRLRRLEAMVCSYLVYAKTDSPLVTPSVRDSLNWVTGGRVATFLRRHLFLMIGILSLSLWYLAAESGAGGPALRGPLFVLIAPVYLAWMVESAILAAIAGFMPAGPIGTAVSLITFASGLAPYVLADCVRNRRRTVAAIQSLNLK